VTEKSLNKNTYFSRLEMPYEVDERSLILTLFGAFVKNCISCIRISTAEIMDVKGAQEMILRPNN
jgi:hypothetical protein